MSGGSKQPAAAGASQLEFEAHQAAVSAAAAAASQRRRRIGELVASWASGASADSIHQPLAASGSIFTPKVLARIEQAIKAGEVTHSGQVRFVVEGALDGAPLFRGQMPRERALDIFSQLRVWDTEHNNGVLIYLLLADPRRRDHRRPRH